MAEKAQDNGRYFTVPYFLFEERFKGISCYAKLLYGLLLNRESLSRKNGWTDGKGDVYLIFTQTEAMDKLGCSKQKAIKVFAELEQAELIYCKRQAKGKPNLIHMPQSGVQDVPPDCSSSMQDEPGWSNSHTPTSAQKTPEAVCYVDPSYLNSYPDMSYPDIIYYERELLVVLTENKGIPESILGEKELLEAILRFLMEYDIFESGYNIPLEQEIYNNVFSALLDMLTTENAKYNKQSVSNRQVVVALNRCIDFWNDGASLMDFVNIFILEYKEILSEQTIKSPLNHIKACLWNRLGAFPLERQADLAKLDF